MLEHLILRAQGGLCNRLRAIACARRLCQRMGAKCSLVWNWGDFWHFFAPFSGMDVLSYKPLCSGRHQRIGDLPTGQRVVDVRATTLKIKAAHVFWGNDEPQIGTADVVPFVPRLHARLETLVEEFAAERLSLAVGFHIRRTDNELAIASSPDALFLAEAERVIATGWNIFLATDNLATERMMTNRFGASIITFPRRQKLSERWPRPDFDPIAVDDDLLDLFLLARTNFVIGCQCSSYSGMAMALNGSPLCRKLELPEPQIRSAA
jgi:hypothetical protein